MCSICRTTGWEAPSLLSTKPVFDSSTCPITSCLARSWWPQLWSDLIRRRFEEFESVREQADNPCRTPGVGFGWKGMSPHSYPFSKLPSSLSSSNRAKLTKIIAGSLGGSMALLLCVLLLWIGCRRLKEDASRGVFVGRGGTREPLGQNVVAGHPFANQPLIFSLFCFSFLIFFSFFIIMFYNFLVLMNFLLLNFGESSLTP